MTDSEHHLTPSERRIMKSALSTSTRPVGDDVPEQRDGEVSVRRQALARWLERYMYAHEADSEWERYLDAADEIIEVLDRADRGVTKSTPITYLGRSMVLVHHPNGELEMVEASEGRPAS